MNLRSGKVAGWDGKSNPYTVRVFHYFPAQFVPVAFALKVVFQQAKANVVVLLCLIDCIHDAPCHHKDKQRRPCSRPCQKPDNQKLVRSSHVVCGGSRTTGIQARSEWSQRQPLQVRIRLPCLRRPLPYCNQIIEMGKRCDKIDRSGHDGISCLGLQSS
jgi:hypothetical protein